MPAARTQVSPAPETPTICSSGESRYPDLWELPGHSSRRATLGSGMSPDRPSRSLRTVRGLASSAEAGLVVAAYTAEGPEATAWASHATAAAFLATGRATFDHERLPELIARNFVGGGRTLVSESSVMEAATVVDLSGSEASSRSYWPAAERWAAEAEQEAVINAESALRATLTQRASSLGRMELGLTAGLDSTVAALVLKDLGIPVRAFTWAREGGPEVAEALRTSEVLGIEHQRLTPVEPEPGSSVGWIHSRSRWSEGIGAASVVERSWPPGMAAAIVGVGGEIGRAFFYTAGVANAFPRPSPRQLLRFFDAGRAIRTATRRARRLLRNAESAWIEESLEAGLTGWRCLDFVYGEQRVRNWGRSMTPHLNAPVISAFATPEVARAMSSMPLEARVADGFHRALLARNGALSLDPPDTPGDPSALRAAAARIPGARFAAHQVRVRRRPRDTELWDGRDVWSRHPEAQDWIACHALESAAVIDVMGDRWAGETARGFLAGHKHATETAMQAAGAVAFLESLEDVRSVG